MCSASGSKLLKSLTKPSKIADVLDWKKMRGSIVTLDIGNKCIGVAIASHPSYGERIQTCKPINMRLEIKSQKKRQTILSKEIVSELENIVEKHNACGFVVTWPVQKEGRCGAPCGRVLHTLDSILEESTSIFTPSRPFCLWDGNHISQQEDDWGRNSIYGEAYTRKTVHVASVEQYEHKSSSTTAADIWTDFCKAHWPKLYNHVHDEQADSDISKEFIPKKDHNECDQSDSYIKSVRS